MMKKECSYQKAATAFLLVVVVKIIFLSYFTNHSSSWTMYIPPKHQSHEAVIEQKDAKSLIKVNLQNIRNMLPALVDTSIASSAVERLAEIEKVILDSANMQNRWHTLPDRFERLNENVIYKPFNIQKPINRENVNVIFIVSSAPARLERRNAIRETWWSHCKSSTRVSIRCVFLTDAKEKTSQVGKDLIEESDKYQDLFFQKLEGGHDFGKRFLYHLVWAMQNYDFDYFLRLDDDYFVCMDRFLQEIPMPPRKQYHWGWVHCVNEIVRPEESIILLSRDIVESFLGQDEEKMLCHRWADQMIGVWKEELKLPTYYHHDDRLHHDPPAQYVEKFKTQTNICTNYIGIHGAYPVQMRTLWKNRGPSDYLKNRSFDDYSHKCNYENVMKWRLFSEEWRAEPKLCKSNPFWGGSKGTTYIGREGH